MEFEFELKKRKGKKNIFERTSILVAYSGD